MNGVLDAGIHLIQYLQSLGEWPIPLMKFFSSLGVEEFYLLVAPVIYWCLDTTIGFRTAMMLMLSGGINNYAKWLLHGPRPFWVSPQVKAFWYESSFGVPSGHAQNAVTIWGIIASSFRKKWLWAVAIALMLMIGLSRLFLGAHFPHDVLAGWLVGLVLLVLFIRLEPPVVAWMRKQTTRKKIGVFLAISMGSILLGWGILQTLNNWEIPALWVQNARQAFPEEGKPSPASLSSIITIGGAFFGLASGYVLLFSQTGFDPTGNLWARSGRYLLGVVGIVALWAGLDALFPEGDTLIPYVFRYIRYALVGLWMTYLGPRCFIGLKLAEPSRGKRSG